MATPDSIKNTTQDRMSGISATPMFEAKLGMADFIEMQNCSTHPDSLQS